LQDQQELQQKISEAAATGAGYLKLIPAACPGVIFPAGHLGMENEVKEMKRLINSRRSLNCAGLIIENWQLTGLYETTGIISLHNSVYTCKM